ncbi:MAG: hypothetical protein WC438_06365 [Candidatus Pacearchaeota archaeon]
MLIEIILGFLIGILLTYLFAQTIGAILNGDLTEFILLIIVWILLLLFALPFFYD